MQVLDGKLVPLGQEQIADCSGVVRLTVPERASYALIMPATKAVRFRDDGTAPTAAVGMPIPVDTYFWCISDLRKLRFIEQEASAELNVAYYREAGGTV